MLPEVRKAGIDLLGDWQFTLPRREARMVVFLLWLFCVRFVVLLCLFCVSFVFLCFFCVIFVFLCVRSICIFVFFYCPVNVKFTSGLRWVYVTFTSGSR